jgi:hypothetical protein
MKFDVLVNKLDFKAYVESETVPGVFYKIVSDDVGVLSCSCKGFQNRFNCKHVSGVIKELGLL